MSTIAHIAVVIPAADEQDHIVGCLTALAVARARLHRVRPDVTCDVIVVCDDCADATAPFAKAAGAHVIEIGDRCVGAARQHGALTALTRTDVAPERLWLANTDADSAVDPEWLTDHLAHAEAGAHLVAGTVTPEASDRLLARWTQVHSLRDGHDHVHGANLGLRADVLLNLGGWPPLRTGEDVALVAQVTASGYVVARTGRHPVRTSARQVGRAPKGFSSYLAALDDA